MVLMTFHTEDTVGGVLRLLNMGIEAFLIASTVTCVLAQRLLRRICLHCAAPYTPTLDEYRRLGYSHDDLGGQPAGWAWLFSMPFHRLHWAGRDF